MKLGSALNVWLGYATTADTVAFDTLDWCWCCATSCLSKATTGTRTPPGVVGANGVLDP